MPPKLGAHVIPFWDLWRRAEEGPECSERDFDMRLFRKIIELKKEYDIKFDPNQPLPIDASLAKDIYQAGLMCFLDLGTLCTTSGRVIKVTEEEVKEALKKAPRELSVGQGSDAVKIGGNIPGAGGKVVVAGGPAASPISESLYLKTMYSYAKEPVVDILYSGLLNSIEGMMIKPRTPLEMAAARREALLAREALRMAGRTGLCITGLVHVTAEATAFADCPEGLRPTDIHEIDLLNELKIDVETLKRIYYCQENGYIISSMACPLVGGFAGGAEGVAIVGVAEALQSYTIVGAHLFQLAICNIHTRSGTDKATLWAGAAALLALKTAQNVIAGDLMWVAAGPCTDVVCYEIAAKTIADVVCGADVISSAGCTGGKMVDHYTGMEARIAGSIARAVSRMGLKQASDIVRELVNLYNDRVIRKELPKPKSFSECYNLESVTPTAEYLKIWEDCKKKLEELGLKILE